MRLPSILLWPLIYPPNLFSKGDFFKPILLQTESLKIKSSDDEEQWRHYKQLIHNEKKQSKVYCCSYETEDS